MPAVELLLPQSLNRGVEIALTVACFCCETLRGGEQSACQEGEPESAN